MSTRQSTLTTLDNLIRADWLLGPLLKGRV